MRQRQRHLAEFPASPLGAPPATGGHGRRAEASSAPDRAPGRQVSGLEAVVEQREVVGRLGVLQGSRGTNLAHV